MPRPRPSLEFLDPDYHFQPADLEIQPTENQPELVSTGEPGDVVTCILSWSPSDGIKHYDLIAIGSTFEEADGHESSGRFSCFSTKQAKGGPGIEVKLLYSRIFPGNPVYSMCAFDISSILISTGRDVIMLRLDFEMKKLAPLSTFRLPSESIALQAIGPFVYASTMYHSLTILQRDGNKLNHYANDIQSRNTLNMAASGDGTVLLSTMTEHSDAEIVGFSSRVFHKQSDLMFRVGLPLIVNDLRPRFTLQVMDASAQSFYATTIDGTMYSLMMLGNHQWRFLYFLQTLVMGRTHEPLFLDQRWEKINRWRSGLSAPRPSDRYINADLFLPLLSEGPVGLQDLLSMELSGSVADAAGSLASPLERLRFFCSLTKALLTETHDPVEDAVKWLRKLLRP